MTKIAKIKKNKKGYLLKEFWIELAVKRRMTPGAMITIQDNKVDRKQVCPICTEYEHHAPYGPWAFAGIDRFINLAICRRCIVKHLPDLLPALKKQRAKWNKENPDEAYQYF